jgi:hypothetical protein
MFSVRSGSGADRFDVVRSRAERIRLIGAGTPEQNRRIGRNTLLLQIINSALASNALKRSVSPSDELAAVRADGRFGRVSDNMATIAAS